MSAVRRMIAAALALGGGLLGSAPAHAAWTTPTPISAATGSVSSSSTVVAPDGTVTALWVRDAASGKQVEAAQRTPGGSWSAPVKLSSADAVFPRFASAPPRLAVNATGEIRAAWAEVAAADDDFRYAAHSHVGTALKVPGGAWSSSPLRVADAAGTDDVAASGSAPSLAVTSTGRMQISWLDGSDLNWSEQEPGGSWSTPAVIASGRVETEVVETPEHQLIEQTWEIADAKLATCGGRTTALMRVDYNYSWSILTPDGEPAGVGGGYSAAPIVHAVSTAPGGGWPSGAGLGQELALGAEDDVAKVACAPSGALTAASVGAFETCNKGGCDANPHLVTATLGSGVGTWSSGITGPTEDYGFPMDMTNEHHALAVDADGAQLSALESGGKIRLYAKWSSGTANALVSDDAASHPALSVAPSGTQWLGYARPTTGGDEIVVRSRPGGGQPWTSAVAVSDMSTDPANLALTGDAADRQTLTFTGVEGGVRRLYAATYTPPAPTPTPSPTPTPTPTPSASPTPGTGSAGEGTPMPIPTPTPTPTPSPTPPATPQPTPLSEGTKPPVPVPVPLPTLPPHAPGPPVTLPVLPVTPGTKAHRSHGRAVIERLRLKISDKEIKRLKISGDGLVFRVRCIGGKKVGCPAKPGTMKKKGSAYELRGGLIRRALRPGARIDIQITAADTVGRVVRLKVTTGGKLTRTVRCLDPGATKARSCTS